MAMIVNNLKNKSLYHFIKYKMGGSSWVLHCGSQFKAPGQSNVDFDLNLNQTLEFPDETKCSITNIAVPLNFPNTCDSFDNRTWKFKFRMYCLPTLTRGTNSHNRTLSSYIVDENTMNSTVLHSEYEMVVRVPEGSYQQSDKELNFTENSTLPQIAGCVRPPIRINDINATTAPIYNSVTGIASNVNYSDLGQVANMVGSAIPLNNGEPWHSEAWSQLLLPSHRFGINAAQRNRFFNEALQSAIWKAQQDIRISSLLGTDGLGAALNTWTEPNIATAAQLNENEKYKLRILKFLISEMNITVMPHANTQLSFAIRSNFAQNSDLATNIQNYLANGQFFTPMFTSYGIFAGAASSGQLTTYKQLNPWMIGTYTSGTLNGMPTHFIQCQITAPDGIRFKGRSVTNSLDYYSMQYRQTGTANQNTAVLITSNDAHWKSTGGSNTVAFSENASQQIGAGGTVPMAPSGNFTPYGLTWTSFSIEADRSDYFKNFVKQDGSDGWFACCYFGLKTPSSDSTSTNTAASAAEAADRFPFADQGVFMYAPMTEDRGTTLHLQYINDVQVNHTRNTSTINYATANAPGTNDHQLVSYPNATVSPPSLNAEYLSGVFTGYTVFVSSNSFRYKSIPAIGAENLGLIYNNYPTMDCESFKSIIIEIEFNGMSIGNHMKFTGSGECKRVRMTKRIPISNIEWGEIKTVNQDSSDMVDYGTCLGLSKVSSIKCRILNEKGEILKLANVDSFPPWTFSLCFEC